MNKNLITQKVQFKYAQPGPFIFVDAKILPGELAVPADQVSTGKPPLPEVNQVTGEKIDRAYLLKLVNVNRSLYERLVRNHGAKAVTSRLLQG